MFSDTDIQLHGAVLVSHNSTIRRYLRLLSPSSGCYHGHPASKRTIPPAGVCPIRAMAVQAIESRYTRSAVA